MRTPLNQKGQAVQVHTFSEDSIKTNIEMTDAAAVVVDVNEARGRIIQITSNISFMLRLAKGATPSVSLSTAHMFLTSGVPYYIKVPGSESADVAFQWHLHTMGLSGEGSGRLTVMEIEQAM